jgi:hypothetical protein
MAPSTDRSYLEHVFIARNNLYALIAGWNVGTVRTAIDALDLGSSFILSGGLSVVVSRHPAVFGPLLQRKSPPLGLQREVTGGERGAARRARDGFRRVVREGIEPRLADIVGNLAMGGFQILQHVWSASADASTLEPTTTLWPSSCVWWNPFTRGLEAITAEGRIPIVDGDGKWTVIGSGEKPFLNGAIRALAEAWAAARYAERDEAALSAYLGRLCPIGIAPENIQPGTKEGDEFLLSVKSLGEAQSGGIFPFGSDVKTLANIDAGAAALFTGFLDRRERAFAIALLGTDGTVSKGSPGVYTSPLFAGVAFANVRSDTSTIGDGITRLGAVYGAVNSGLSHEESPGYRWLLPDPTEADRVKATGDAFARAAAAVTAERAAGLEMTPERLAVIYGGQGIPVPTMPASAAKAPIFAYHIEQNIVAPDQVLETLGLPPLPGGVGSPAALAAHILALRAAELTAAQGPAPAPDAPVEPAPAGP